MKTLLPGEATDAIEARVGYCTNCENLDWDGSIIEPDASGQLCSLCCHKTKLGVELALLQGEVQVAVTQQTTVGIKK